jgi:transcriptional regulator with XRE-family HTH domain
VDFLSDGDRIAWRRRRLGWNQGQLSDAAGVGLTTIVQIEKDRNVQRAKWRAVEHALDAAERDRGLPSLQIAAPAPEPRNQSGLTSPVLPPSTNRTNVPRGEPDDDSASTRIRELENRLERQEAQLEEMRKMLKRLARIATERAESRAAGKTPTSRRRSNR